MKGERKSRMGSGEWKKCGCLVDAIRSNDFEYSIASEPNGKKLGFSFIFGSLGVSISICAKRISSK